LRPWQLPRTHPWIVLAGCLVALATLVHGTNCRAEDDPLEDYRLAVGFYKKEHWKLATDSFQAFLAKNEKHPRAESARFYYGLSLTKLDEFEKARGVLRAYLKDYPKGRDVAAAGYWLGHCSFHLDDFAAAEQELSAFLESAPGNPLREWALPYLGDAQLRLMKTEPALKQFQTALDEYPRGALAEEAKFGLARASEILKKFPEAIRAYQDLANNAEGSRAAEAQLNLGALYFDSGRFAEAAGAYETLESRFPESPQTPLARRNLGFARYQLHEYREAIVQFDRTAKIERFAAESILWKGLALKALSELPEASAVLQAGYEKHKEHALAEKLLFQWADCEQRRGSLDRARELFLEVVSRWPKGTLADESLHAACVAAIGAGKLPEAEALVARFDREFPGNRLRSRQEIVKGRLLVAKNDLAGATRQFEAVIEGSEVESTRWQARYYLGDVMQRGGRHLDVLEVTAPLAALWDQRSGPPEFTGVFVLRGASSLALARAAAATEKSTEPSPEKMLRCAEAIASAERYLKSADTVMAPQARLILTSSLALSGLKPRAEAELEAFRQKHPSTEEFHQTVYDVGTIAYSRHDWEWAESLFAELAGHAKESRWRLRAMADLGWARQKQKKYAEAAATFQRVVSESPAGELAAEAAFMHGSALQDAGRIAEAQTAFAEAFSRTEASEHVFLAGLQSSRLLMRLKKPVEGDAAYEALLKRFPNRPDADKILDEWATSHYAAEDFARADALFKRLATEFPTSPLADNARLSLAESDLVGGRLDEARRQLEALSGDAAADETVQQRALYQWMQVELESRRWSELRKVSEELLRRFPEGAHRHDAAWMQAQADYHSGAYPPALERLKQLRELPEDQLAPQTAWRGQVWILLAETHLKLKDYDAVLAVAAELRAQEPPAPCLHQVEEVVGRAFKAQARWSEAREAFERVIKDPRGKLTETAAKSQFLLAETYFHEKNFESAIREYLKVDILYKFPEWQAPALIEAAQCQENLKQWKEAGKTYADVLKNYPSDQHAPKAREGLERVRKKLAAG
jgi:cellulose synthase operon protein C